MKILNKKKRNGLRKGFGVKRVVHKVQQETADERDIVFWQNKRPEQKLSALQVMREQQRKFLSQKGFHRASRSRSAGRRVFKIIKQA